jgi:DNA polymerase I-like protein with 3'-5' exonuclease and polymerase domains
VIGVSIATDHGIKGYWPVRHEGGDNLDLEKVFGWLRTELRTDISKVGANILYDLEGLTAEGIFVGGTKIDVQVAEALLDETLYSYKLDVLAERYLGVKKDETLLRQAAESLGLDPKSEMYKLPARFVGPYAEADADLTLRIWQAQEPKIAQEDLSRVFELECRLIECLLQMRFNGVPVDLDKADQARTLILQKRDDIAKRIKDICGFEVQVMAPRSVAAALSTQNIEYGKTLLGNPTFPADWLDNHEAELCRLIVQQRRYEKAVGTFIDNMIFDMVSPKGRLHPSFRSAKSDDGGTRSGRFASNKPNCFPGHVEVLTELGFVRFDQLRSGIKLASWNKGAISFDSPTDYHARSYYGPFVHVKSAHQVDMITTPEHRYLLQKANGQYVAVQACDLQQAPKSAKILHAGTYDNIGTKLTEAELIVACSLQADGSIRDNVWRYGFRKPRKIKRLVQGLKELKIPHQVKIFESQGNKTTVVWGKVEDLPIKVTDLLWQKQFDVQKLLFLDQETRVRFLKEVLFWDGQDRKNHSGLYSSSQTSNIDAVQAVAAVTGYRGVSTKHKRTNYVTLQSRTLHTYLEQCTIKEIPALSESTVYCVTMPHDTILVRLNGRVQVIHQCQQIPARDPELGPMIRKLFVPEPGYQWGCFDYSQQEPRVTVHYARLMADFLKGQVTQSDRDGQSRLAAMLSADEAVRMYQENPDIDYHQMIADMANISRKPAKTLNLGAAYGMGKAKMMRQLGVDMQAAVEIYEKYHVAVPYVKQLGNECMQLAQQRGWVKTLLGRKRRYKLWEPRYSEKGSRPVPLPREQAVAKWGEANIKRAMTHNALNAIVQGSSADMIKTAMVLCHEQKLGIMHLTVHDELDFSVMPDDVPKIKEIMEHAMSLVVPLKVDVELGPSWGDAK